MGGWSKKNYQNLTSILKIKRQFFDIFSDKPPLNAPQRAIFSGILGSKIAFFGAWKI